MTNHQREKNNFSKHIVIHATGTKLVNIDKQLWQIKDHLHQTAYSKQTPCCTSHTASASSTTRARCSTKYRSSTTGSTTTPPAQVPNPAQPQLNWSYSKPEFPGKPDEDAEAHLLRTNDWMETHNFPEVAKVLRFCLTLSREARLWYKSLRPIVIYWTGLQEQFRQQYSKIGNT